MLKFHICICIKEDDGGTWSNDNPVFPRFRVNDRYKFRYVEGMLAQGVLIYLSNRVSYFNIFNFNEYFIDLQEYRQKVLNQLVYE